MGYSNPKFIVQLGTELVSPEQIINEAASQARVECSPFRVAGNGTEYLEVHGDADTFYCFGGSVDLYVNGFRILTVQHEPSQRQIVLKDNDKRPPTILATLTISEQIIKGSDDHSSTVNALKALIFKFLESKSVLRKVMRFS